MDDTDPLLDNDLLINKPDQEPVVNTTEKVVLKTVKKSDVHNLYVRAVQEWEVYSVALVALFVAAGFALLIPYFVGQFVTSTLSLTPEDIRNTVVKLLGVGFGTAFAGLIRSASLQIAGQRVVTRLREDLFNTFLSQEMGFFDQSRTGEITSRLVSDTASVQYALTWNLSNCLTNAVSIVGSVGMMFYTSWQLSLVILGTIPIVGIGAFVYGKFIEQLSSATQDKFAQTTSFSEEVISNIQTVRSFSGENYSRKAHSIRLAYVYQLLKKRALANAAFEAVASIVASVTIAGILWYGAYLVNSKELSPGNLSSYLLYTISAVSGLNGIAAVYPSFMEAIGATRRIFQLLQRVPKVPPHERKVPPESLSGSIIFSNVSFTYPTRPNHPVLDSINLTLYPGKVVALVGPSGGGKTTIAKLLLGLYYPNKGAITINGVNINTYEPRLWRRKFGVVNQEPSLFASSIEKNILYALDSITDDEVKAHSFKNYTPPSLSEVEDALQKKQKGEGASQDPFEYLLDDKSKDYDSRVELCRKAAKSANALDFIEQLPDRYDTMVGERGARLSGGQKQRVAIARALVRNPSILVLDEATSALDSESEHQVQKALDSLLANCQGKYMIVIAHRLSTVMNAHEIVVVDQGRIAERGNHVDLLKKGGKYKELVERQLASTS